MRHQVENPLEMFSVPIASPDRLWNLWIRPMVLKVGKDMICNRSRLWDFLARPQNNCCESTKGINTNRSPVRLPRPGVSLELQLMPLLYTLKISLHCIKVGLFEKVSLFYNTMIIFIDLWTCNFWDWPVMKVGIWMVMMKLLRQIWKPTVGPTSKQSKSSPREPNKTSYPSLSLFV